MAPLEILVAGAGSRGTTYAEWALRHPDRARVVAVAEPRDAYRDALGDAHGIPPERRYRDWREAGDYGRHPAPGLDNQVHGAGNAVVIHAHGNDVVRVVAHGGGNGAFPQAEIPDEGQGRRGILVAVDHGELEYVVGGLISAGLLIYLLWALVQPERF